MPVGLPIETDVADSDTGGRAPPATVEIVYAGADSWATPYRWEPPSNSRTFKVKSTFLTLSMSLKTARRLDPFLLELVFAPDRRSTLIESSS